MPNIGNFFKYRTICTYSGREPIKSVQYDDESMLSQIDAIHEYAKISGVQSISVILVDENKEVYKWLRPNIGT